MSTLPKLGLNGLVVRGPLLTLVRTSANINIQKPKLPHWDKARFQQLTKRQLPQPRDLLSEHRGCFHAVETRPDKEVNPLEVLIGSKIREECEKSQLMVLFHRNPISMSEVHKTWQTLKRAGFTYHKLFNNSIARHAFEGTRLEPLLVLCRSHTSLVTCPEPRVAKLLGMQKKLPQFTAIGGVVEGRFLSVPDLQAYAHLPGLPALHAQLSHLLATPAARVSGALTHHQSALVRSLAAYSGAAADTARDSSTETSASEAPPSPESETER